MAIDKQLGTEDNPDIRTIGSAVEVQPDTSREDQIRQAAEILVAVVVNVATSPTSVPKELKVVLRVSKVSVVATLLIAILLYYFL